MHIYCQSGKTNDMFQNLQNLTILNLFLEKENFIDCNVIAAG